MWFSDWLRCDWRGRKRPRVYRWSERNKPPSLGERRWREDISVGWLKLLMSCFTSYLPSPVLSFPLPGIFSTHRRRALPSRLRCQSEARLPSRPLHLFCHFSRVSVRLALALVSSSWPSAWHLFFLFSFPLYVIDLAKRLVQPMRLVQLLAQDGSHPTRMFCNAENEVV